jgi:hypothetical protein
MVEYPVQASILLHLEVHIQIELEYLILSLTDNSVIPFSG